MTMDLVVSPTMNMLFTILEVASFVLRIYYQLILTVVVLLFNRVLVT